MSIDSSVRRHVELGRTTERRNAMGDLRATTLTGWEITLPAAAVDAFKQRLRGPLIAPGDARCAEARQVWNANIDRRPGLICRPVGAADVLSAVHFARDHRIGSPRAITWWSPVSGCSVPTSPPEVVNHRRPGASGSAD
jgi:hypothetical protein